MERMETEQSSFNLWIKQRRRALDLTQEDLSECVGCSTITIQKIELGERRPSKQVALRLAECLRLPSDEYEEFVRFARGEQGAGLSPLGTATRSTVVPPSPTPNNLPAPLTPLIGREDALGAAHNYLLRQDIRLLTFTGVPGIGKTRLSLDVAAHLLPDFGDGVFFVELAPIAEPDLVASTVATTLGCKEMGHGSHVDWLKEFVRDQRMLMVLDNFEQVLDAAPVVVEMLRTCSALKVLVTSREALHVMGEQQFPVPPLEVPDLTHLPDTRDDQSLLSYPAVTLFMQCARAVDPSFALTEENYRIVAAICTRLEGLPLAIELAAARIKVLTPEELFSHLDKRLRLLTGGSRHLPERLQTLRGAIDWSYRLLDEIEQNLFACLGVFVGGATLSAIQAIYTVQGDPLDVLEGVGSLLDKNLLRREASRPRFTMLEMIREYASEKLVERTTAQTIKRAHALFFLQLAEEAALGAHGPEETSGLDSLEEEHDNLRAALQWCQSKEAGTDGIETGLRLVVVLGRFWYVRGYVSEGRERIASVLSSAEAMEPQVKSLRAWALIWAGNLAFLQADYPAVRVALEEALALFRALGDKKGIAQSLLNLGDTSREQGNYDAALPLFEQSLSIFREIGDGPGTTVVLSLMSWGEMRLGFFAQATDHLQESLQIARQEQNTGDVALALSGLGEVMVLQGEYEEATPLLEESLAIRRAIGNKWSTATSLGALGWVALRQGNLGQAAELISESLTLRKDLRDKGGVTWCLEKFAQIAVEKGDPVRAARLLGAAKSLRDSIHNDVDIADRPDFEQTMNAVRSGLSEQAFANGYEQGKTMSLEQIVSYAQATPEASDLSPMSIQSTTDTEF
jgi:predicted ATPase/transcriptional regulator with XRE-family HTH domain